MPDCGSVILAIFIENMRARELAQSLTQIHEAIQRANGKIQYVKMFFQMRTVWIPTRDRYCWRQSAQTFWFSAKSVVEAKKRRLWLDNIFPSLFPFYELQPSQQDCRLNCEDIVPNPCRGLLESLCQLCKRGWRGHQQAQDFIRRLVGQQFDLV